MALRRIWVFGLLALGLGLLAFFQPASSGRYSYDLEISGETFAAQSASFKCDLAPIDGLSTRRLVDCNSASLLTFDHQGVQKELVRFQIDPDDRQINAGVRAELRDMHEAVDGEETWYRFSTLIPADFPVESEHRLVLAQWHEHLRGEGHDLRPPLSHRLWNGRFVVTLWNNRRVAERGPRGDGEILFEIPRIKQDVFYEFVYKVKWSGDDDGEIVAWMRECSGANPHCSDGTPWHEIVRYSGSTGYDAEIVNGYYFKYGLYTVSAFDETFVAYHKNYRRGESALAVGATDPVFQVKSAPDAPRVPLT